MRVPEDLTQVLETIAGHSRRRIKMAQDQHQETEATSVMVITWLTPPEAKTLAEMASARYTTTADTVRQAVKKLLRETRYHGPGHTREQLREMMVQSPLSIILDPDALWDQSDLDETTRWPTDTEGNDLIDEVNFAVGNNPSIPYMTATLVQDNPATTPLARVPVAIDRRPRRTGRPAGRGVPERNVHGSMPSTIRSLLGTTPHQRSDNDPKSERATPCTKRPDR